MMLLSKAGPRGRGNGLPLAGITQELWQSIMSVANANTNCSSTNSDAAAYNNAATNSGGSGENVGGESGVQKGYHNGEEDQLHSTPLSNYGETTSSISTTTTTNTAAVGGYNAKNSVNKDNRGSYNRSNNNSNNNQHSNGNLNKLVVNKKGVDWNCPACDNLNWNWRNNCNTCGEKKPKIDALANDADAVRDGAGGGFNERQGRASKASVEIDDEGFDDFGQKKGSTSKKGGEDKRLKEEAALKRLQANYGFLGGLMDDGGGADGGNDNDNNNSSSSSSSSKRGKKRSRSRSNDRRDERRSDRRDSRDRRDRDRDDTRSRRDDDRRR